MFNSRITDEIKKKEFREKYKNDSKLTRVFYTEMFKILEDSGITKYEHEFYHGNEPYFQKEKLTVDITGWVSQYDGNIQKIKRKDYPKELNGYEWNYLFLIEHENSGKTWLHEMQKLCSIKAPYKLIITYGRTLDNLDGFEKTVDKKGVSMLKYAEKILKNIGNHDCEEFILMFGEENKNLNKLGEKSVYDIYRYIKAEDDKESRFEKI